MLKTLTKLAEQDIWTLRPLLEDLLDKHGDTVLSLRQTARGLPGCDKYAHTVYYNLDSQYVYLHHADFPTRLVNHWNQELQKQAQAVAIATEQPRPRDYFQSSWVLIKQSFSPTAKAFTDLAGWTPGPVNQWYGGPTPLAATLLGGLAGAGLGYAGGALAEQVVPEKYLRRGRLRKTLALLGGLTGSLPGAGWGAVNVQEKGWPGLVSSWPLEDGKAASALLAPCQAMRAVLQDVPLHPAFRKAAQYDSGAGSELDAPIDVDSFGRVLWSPQDPFTPPSIRAATVGLVDAASLARSGSPTVTPGDIASVGVGMGTGLASGWLVGKTLGALAGLTPTAQQALQRAGMWTGVLKAVVPMVFG